MISRTALILPTGMECRAVRGRLRPNWVGRCQGVPVWRIHELWILQPGMGLDGVQRSIRAMQELAIQHIWLAGWCGGLNPEMRCGDIILPDSVLTLEGNRFPLVHPPRIEAIMRKVAVTSGVTVTSGPVLSVERLIHDAKEKRTMQQAVAVEIEALPLHAWATQAQKSFFHLRVVLDPEDSSLPTASFWNILLFWSQVKALARFFWHARKANRVLASVVEAIVNEGLSDSIQASTRLDINPPAIAIQTNSGTNPR